MKTVFTVIAAAMLASSFAMPADAAAQAKNRAIAQRQAECQAQAKQKYTAIHFLKRRAFVKNCMGQKT
jgi:Ni/Co efflux regulator RcnB